MPDKLNQRIGIVGGGQLGKMMILEAKKLGFRVAILDPGPNCPAHSIADDHIVAGFGDYDAYFALAERADIVTCELEHVNTEALAALEAGGKPVRPSAASIRVIQDKLLQKSALARAGLPTPEFRPTRGVQDVYDCAERFGYPFLLKAARGGYDGRGNRLIGGAGDIPAAFGALGPECFAERFAAFEKEVSVLACRGLDGGIAVYPVAENTHAENILRETRVPAAVSPEQSAAAVELARRVMQVFDGVGMFCVEMFIGDKCGPSGVCINEVAPRPHNSGHYTIEGCVTSQFEQHIRAVCGLPLGSAALLSPCVTRNLLGAEGASGEAAYMGVEEALAIEGLSLHIYGKERTSPRRKMGHFTVIAPTLESAVEKSGQAAAVLRCRAGNK